MVKLHPKQTKILELLKENIDHPLTLQALSVQAGIESPGVLYHHLRQLEKKGYIKRNPDNPRDFLVMDTPEKAVAYINKYGLAQCGEDGSILSGDVIDRIPIATSLLRFPASEAFIVEAKGNSMEPKIKDGDIIIARKQSHAEPGDIVVCVHDEKALIKQFLLVGKRIVLHSLNEEHDLIEARDGFKIEGVVKNIIHYD